MPKGQGHAARAVWNLLHEWYTCRDGGIAKRPSIAEMDRQLRDARTKPLPAWEWRNDLPAQAMQQILKHYLRAWDRYFGGVVGPPRFKQRCSKMAVDAPSRQAQYQALEPPLGTGSDPVRRSGALPLDSSTPWRLVWLSGADHWRSAGKDPLGWHICFRIREPAVVVTPNPGPPIGIDRGVVTTLALSDGRGMAMPSLLSPGERGRMLGLERKAARQQLARRRSWGPGRLKQPMSRRHRRSAVQIAELRAARPAAARTGCTRGLPLISPRVTA
jgi:putative transposase